MYIYVLLINYLVIIINYLKYFLYTNIIMNSNCPPIHLPIQIEASCKSSKSNCCDTTVNSACTIDPFFLSQGSFQDSCTKEVIKAPKLDLAFISNISKDLPADSRIVLNPVCLSWCDFLTLFFTTNNAFYVNTNNAKNCYINFNTQTYENTTSKCMSFNLADQVRQAWAVKCETSINNMPARTQLLLNKETFVIKGLASSISTISLTLDQVIETLLANNQIAPGDINTEATVTFVIAYKYYFKPLDTCIEIDFVFVTKIPCYKNVNECIPWCSPYSKDSNCRSCLDVVDETNVLSFIKDNNFDMNNLFFDTTSTNDENDSLGDLTKNKDNLDTVSIDDNISLDSSKW